MTIRKLAAVMRQECPLCTGPGPLAPLCQGCLMDTYMAMRSRRVCLGCAQDFLQGQATVMAATGFKADCRADQKPMESDVQYCRRCMRQQRCGSRIVCALDGTFPEAILLHRFLKGPAGLMLTDVIAALMWQAWCDEGLQVPQAWLAWPVPSATIDRCLFNPEQALVQRMAVKSRTKAMSARCSSWLQAVVGGVMPAGLRGKVKGLHVGLVMTGMGDPQILHDTCMALRVAGAQQVDVIAAARNLPLWHNSTPCSM